MGSNIITTIGEHLQIRNGKSSPSRTETGEYPVYGSNGIIGYSDEYNANENTIIIGRVGSYCGSVYISDKKCWVTDNAIIGTAKNKNESYFWFYLLKNIDLNNYRTGSGQPLLNQTIINAISVTIPSLSEKKISIGYFIRNFDQKINLSFEINQTLEQMSQTLFKSWFVDFDPVIDNALDAGNPIPEALQSRAELRQKVRNSENFKPLPADIRVLFPAEFEETELGYAPKGWMTNRLENILELAYGKALKKTERTNGNYPVYGSGGVDGTHNEYLVKGPGVIVGRKGTVGSLHWENKNFYPIDTVFFVKPKEYYSLVYCYQLLKTLGLENMNTDAAVPGLNRNNAYRLEVVTPTQSIIAKFTNIIQTIQHKMDSNHNETENLTALRDTLLPKLISGELSLENLPDLVTQTEPA
ncbi:restriction endonuclease subunit S [Klebsiella quasipneumoniae]|uniref:restriction endonuclease subunit S n=1 Tax=Klebsiella quasipneumoniae TaxID=1463165 RepID=UPI000CEBFABA|nr:restriction endonuclease subunit S [Klebsiella quasipneumoniae]ROC54154.1 restriction endonuclease subunit S [Klebsiella quasipneumoniae subsp. quasipneumoniae]HBR2031141.1 restriction endonuclease subunit S [Klebsiella quasipneumoniae subsp. quasipneumoniae]HBR2033076.1 restriction endonuclease subunit S [Klebsiella quasipneumoniae subsp. quasipneumoniae]